MRGRTLLVAIGAEIRLARHGAGLSLEMVGRAASISGAEVSRMERARAEWVSLLTLTRLCSIVGLDLTARAFPGASPLRDARHNAVLGRLRGLIHPGLGWAQEVPLPNPGDQRAWDAVIRGNGWRYGVECEMNPIDGQAAMRRLALKHKEGMVDGLILLLPDTRQTRLLKREYAAALKDAFPCPGSVALARLAVGKDPGGSAIITL